MKRRARRVIAGHAVWSAAGPGGHGGRLHGTRGGGTRAQATAWGWGWGAKGSGRPRAQPATGARVRSLERPWPARRPRASPRVAGWGGSGVRALTAAGAWGSRGCRHWDPTFLRAPGSRPATTPESAVSQSCREAGGGKGCAAGGEPAGPCRSAAAQPSLPGRPPGCPAPYLWSEPLAARAGG